MRKGICSAATLGVFLCGLSLGSLGLALVKAQHPDCRYYQVINQVLRTVDPLKALQGKTVTGGQVNAYRAVTTVLGENTLNSSRVPSPPRCLPAPPVSGTSP